MNYCINCGKKILFGDITYPYCEICGGSCSANNRFSSMGSISYYCFICGEPSYVNSDNPICDRCKSKGEMNGN